MDAAPASLLDPRWSAALARRLDVPEEPSRLPLSGFSGRSPIGSIEPELGERMRADGLPLAAEGVSWRIDSDKGKSLDDAFRRIAHWLEANRLGGRWRDELLTVADRDGRCVGAIERAAVRALGIATTAVHLVGKAEQGGVWVQQRAFDKAVDPGAWDTLMGGLVAHGESILQTLGRETWEEAGLRIEALQGVTPFGRFTVRRPVPDGYMVEHIEMFQATIPREATPVNQDGEVARFECVDLNELVSRMHADRFTLEAAGILSRWLEHQPGLGT